MMLIVPYKKFGLNVSHVWFATEDDLKSGEIKKRHGDLLFVHGASIAPKGGKLFFTQNSLIKELTLNEDELFLTLGKHLRQYIKRSYKEEQVGTRFFEASLLGTDEQYFKDCKQLYENMFRQKHMNVRFNADLAKAYLKQNRLVVGIATLNNEPIGFSAAIYDSENARLWLSAFDFRNKTADSQILSRAHQRLDWELLLWCKERGIKQFDFGGISSFEEPNGIDQFKMNFEHKNRVTYGNYLVPNSLLGEVAVRAFLLRRGK